MDVPLYTPFANPASLHMRALRLAGIFLALFLVAAGLYARFGYAFVLRVFEQHQLGRVADAKGEAKLVEFEDYLRVDPANLLMRGLLINHLIEFKDSAKALAVANDGVGAVSSEHRPIATLFVARAQIGLDQIDAAETTYTDVLASVGESGEAHRGIARISAARGRFDEMQRQYDLLERRGAGASTPDFRSLASVPEPGKRGASDKSMIELAIQLEAKGFARNAIDLLSTVSDFQNGPSTALFLRGVYEEQKDHRVVALNFYKRAADGGDGLGKFAYGRLGGK